MPMDKETPDDDQLAVSSRRQSSLAAFGRRALTAVDFRQLAQEGADLAAAEPGIGHCNVLELMPDGTVQLRASSGQQLDGDQPALPLSEETAAAHVLRTLCPLVIQDDHNQPPFAAPPWHQEQGIASSAIVPLLGPLRPLGLLEAQGSGHRTFSANDASFLQILAHQLSGAMQRISQTQEQRDQKMRRAEQMMAIGQVAAGVAHELRNPLTSIKGLVQVNLREAAHRGVPADDLAVIEHEIRRMERTLQTFLEFARPPQPDRKKLFLNDVVHRVFALVRGRARKQGVTLAHELQPDVVVHADQDQIQQLLLNLVLNALDAMPDGGSIEIRVSEDRDRRVELVVRDTGPGIASHILPKVFETFVSSKETGVGLGLPVSQRIAEDHGGSLSAYNTPGGGACFVLRLPSGH